MYGSTCTYYTSYIHVHVLLVQQCRHFLVHRDIERYAIYDRDNIEGVQDIYRANPDLRQPFWRRLWPPWSVGTVRRKLPWLAGSYSIVLSNLREPHPPRGSCTPLAHAQLRWVLRLLILRYTIPTSLGPAPPGVEGDSVSEAYCRMAEQRWVIHIVHRVSFRSVCVRHNIYAIKHTWAIIACYTRAPHTALHRPQSLLRV